MGYECFEVEVDQKVAHVRMNRPQRSNSMIPAFWNELPQIVDELSSSGSVRAMVLSGEGKHFCSGMDLEVFTNDEAIGDPSGGESEGSKPGHRSRRNERFRSTAMKLQDTFSAMERARMPVLAAIQGACVGGAIDMITACDMRYATEKAFFSIQEINIGMTADVGTLQRMPKLVAEGIVRELAYTGRRWSAAEAKAAGFVNEIYPDQETMIDAVMGVASEIADKSPMAVWGTKQTMHYTRDHGIADGLEYIANWNAAMFDTDDMAEAFKAQMENRAADFPDLFPLSDGL
ncbi:MAG: crotonase/enoyl-CoA hydratase family protein [Acidimicrobiales bacterium]